MTRLFRLSVLTALATYALIVLGGITRIAASGTACGTSWPFCDGKPYPPLEALAIVEYLHRPVAALVAVLVLLTFLAAWVTPGTGAVTRFGVSAAVALITTQLLLGAAGSVWSLPAWISLVHLSLAMLFFAATLLTVLSVAVERGAPAWLAGTWERGQIAPDRAFFWIAAAGSAVIFGLIVSGAVTRTSGATLSCNAWPWCTGETLIPAGSSEATWIDLSHRAVAIIGAITIGIVFSQAMRRNVSGSARRLAQVAAGITLVQLLIGGAYVVTSGSDWLSALHLAAAALLWATMIGVTITATRPVAVTAERDMAETLWTAGASTGAASYAFNAERAQPNAAFDVSSGGAVAAVTPVFYFPDVRQFTSLAKEYLALTKPGILTLLLATTLGGMLAGAAELPPLWLVMVTLLGGAMAAGGANTLNCYIDRDIDALMHRTKKRGTVTGAIPPHGALIFGLSLTAISFLMLGFLVNWLAAVLALAGNAYYVLIYTKWLKRRTPQNIVIGGAAGAMPPVVGWAAATGNVSVAAVLMFAIIYYWTPPHFWALALLKQGEYGRAAVPMLPNVRGEEETRWQVLLYTLMLAAVAMMLAPFGMGWIYVACAAVLNGIFVWYAVMLYRAPSKGLARRTFFYSLWYLALLFGAMVADRLILA